MTDDSIYNNASYNLLRAAIEPERSQAYDIPIYSTQ